MTNLKNMKITLNWAGIIFIIAILFILSYYGYSIYKNNINGLNSKLITEVKLKNALLDSITFRKNKENEWQAEKLTIQGETKVITNINNRLNTSQKELMKRVTETIKENIVINAALISSKIEIDSLKNKMVATIDTIKNSIAFVDSSNGELKYDIVVSNVKPSSSLYKPPEINFKKFELDNKQFVEFHWKDNAKEGYPISFSVSNSNKYFKTTNIDSYAIPELLKPNIKPNGWEKFNTWLKNKGHFLMIFGTTAVLSLSAGALFIK
jgi:hypothetical protein